MQIAMFLYLQLNKLCYFKPLDWAVFLFSDAKQRSSEGEFIPQTRPRSNTLPKSFGSSLDQEDEENEDEMRVVQKEKKPTKEATLELILKRLKEKRVERCLPEDIKVSMRFFLREWGGNRALEIPLYQHHDASG